jgi:tRNA dimethylallyltransferase
MGPTGAGKSAIALELAAMRPTVIINADAMQMVDGLRVITARPTVEQEAQAEHALYGVLAPHEPTTVANWLARVKPRIEQAWAEEKLPLLVGGTGMYVKALMEGLAEIPPIPEETRARLRAMDAPRVRTELERKDPAMAAQLKAGDSQRNLRALEVLEATGVSLAVWQAQTTQAAFPEAQYQRFTVMRDRAEIYARIDARFEAMMTQGALEEVRALMALNLDPELPILRAHGVPELMAYLRGEMTLAEAISKAQQNTRNYAKRQMTWLRNQWPGVPVVRDGAGISIQL